MSTDVPPKANDERSQESLALLVQQLERLQKTHSILNWILGLIAAIISATFWAGYNGHIFVETIQNKAVPPGLIAFFKDAKCPANWDRVDELHGRYVVVADSNDLESIGKEVGDPLTKTESRKAGIPTLVYVRKARQTSADVEANILVKEGNGRQADDKSATIAPYLILNACKSPGP